MIFDLNKKIEMPDPKDALKGRDQSLTVSPKHYVNGEDVQGPYPNDYKELKVAMGCFWGAEKLFWQQDGVYSTSVGYMGGYTKNPTYREVCSGNTGHTEAVLVVYDPKIVSLKELLRIFWEGHDPTQYMRQGNDIGTQYRSAVFYTDLGQRDQATSVINLIPDAVTEISTLDVFYPAESYHQNYYNNNPDQPYCQLVILPKINKYFK